MSSDQPIKVAILWHMHQPNYREPNSQRMAMPWVRLHALKDYLDMPLRAAAFERVKTTFNIVPSLLDQIELYLGGGTDRHLELSRLPAEDLNPTLKLELLETFFSAYPTHMIKPYARYWELYNKARRGDGQRHVLAALFSSAEIRDIQVWSNLAWVDPMFRSEEPIRSLFAKLKQYSEEDKIQLLDWQQTLMARIIPTYRDLLTQGRIDVSFTPYYHPIMPLLCDTNSAQEALPGIKLPAKRFVHPEDADKQIALAVKRYESSFGRPMIGLWPSEGSVSEEVVNLMIKHGIKWTATDEDILYHSLLKSGQDRFSNPAHTVYEYASRIRLFFRDRGLSDRIGFVYSGWKADRAVADFMEHLHNLRRQISGQLDNAVVPVILDGENAWEYFPDDGAEFLRAFYQALDDDPLVETVTFSEAAERITPRPLKSIYAGSWINHNFRVWIGHEEDNLAWDLLTATRDKLVQFEKENPRYDPARLAAAWNQVYIAEGSDWNWWYGDEHRTDHNEEFDKIYRRHLAAVYELIQQEIPFALLKPIAVGKGSSYLVLPDDMVTPKIDGHVSHYYEWTGAGYYDCLKAGGAMHRTDRYIGRIHFAYDRDRLHIRLDFYNKMGVDLLKNPRVVVTFSAESPVTLDLRRDSKGFSGKEAGRFEYAMEEIMELSVERAVLWPQKFGQLGLTVALYEGDRPLESWPESEPLKLDIPEQSKEVFWPM